MPVFTDIWMNRYGIKKNNTLLENIGVAFRIQHKRSHMGISE